MPRCCEECSRPHAGSRRSSPALQAAYLAQSVGLAALESIASGHPVDVQAPPPRTT